MRGSIPVGPAVMLCALPVLATRITPVQARPNQPEPGVQIDSRPVSISIKAYEVYSDSQTARDFDAGVLEPPLKEIKEPRMRVKLLGHLRAAYVPDTKAAYMVGGSTPIVAFAGQAVNQPKIKTTYQRFGLSADVSGQWKDQALALEMELGLESSVGKTKHVFKDKCTVPPGKGHIVELESKNGAQTNKGPKAAANPRILAVIDVSELDSKVSAPDAGNTSTNIALVELVIVSVTCPSDRLSDLNTKTLISDDPDEKALLERLGDYGTSCVNTRFTSWVDLSHETKLIMGDELPLINDYRFARNGEVVPSVSYQDVGCIFEFGPCFWTEGRQGKQGILPIQLEMAGVHESTVRYENLPSLPNMTRLQLEQAMPLTVGQPRYHVWFNMPQTPQVEQVSTITVSRILVTAE